jgi:hypothetical protein
VAGLVAAHDPTGGGGPVLLGAGRLSGLEVEAGQDHADQALGEPIGRRPGDLLFE